MQLPQCLLTNMFCKASTWSDGANWSNCGSNRLPRYEYTMYKSGPCKKTEGQSRVRNDVDRATLMTGKVSPAWDIAYSMLR